MKAKSAISKIKKRLGIDISDEVNAVVNGTAATRKVVIPWKGRVLSFYIDHSCELSTAKVSLVHLRRENDHSDLMTDYHAGYFPSNLTQALDAIEPPDPRFELGALVRVKMRKTRRYAHIQGQVGVVIDNGPHNAKMLWNDGTQSGWIRDNALELVQS